MASWYSKVMQDFGINSRAVFGGDCPRPILRNFLVQVMYHTAVALLFMFRFPSFGIFVGTQGPDLEPKQAHQSQFGRG